MAEHEPFDFSVIPEKKSGEVKMAGASQSKNLCPEDNQDAFFIDPIHQSFGVFDGVNGVPNGKLAAETCSKLIQQYLSELSRYYPNFSNEGIEESLQSICSKTTSAIYKLRQESDTKMGTTGVFGIITTKPDGTRKAFIANIGDSRAYLIRHHVLYKETQDQNYVPYPDQDTLDKLKGKKLIKFKKSLINDDRIIGQLYGEEQIFPQIKEIDLEPKDVLLLVTDGIYKNLTSREISSTYKKNRHEDIEIISQKFIKRAYHRSQENHSRSTPDDLTAVVIKLK